MKNSPIPPQVGRKPHTEIVQLIIFLFITLAMLLFVREARSQNKITFPLNDDSDISYPMGEHLILEGQIAPDYNVAQWGDENSFFAGNISITPKVILKMYRTRSRPVKTPSYMPKITIQAVWKSEIVDLYPYFILSHHSNGQGGETFGDDESKANNDNSTISDSKSSSVNLESGSFATNFIQAGYYFSMAAFKGHYLGLSYEHHPVHGWWFGIDPAIQSLYGRKRLHYDYKYIGNIFQLDVGYTRIIDNPQGIPSGIFSATAKMKSPVFKKAMSFFASYYQGQDYYNINFTNAIKQFKTGIAIETQLAIK